MPALWASSSSDHSRSVRTARTRSPSLRQVAPGFLRAFLRTPIYGQYWRGLSKITIDSKLTLTRDTHWCFLLTEMRQRLNQKIPTAWPEREALRKRGQFWTPPWLAEAMAAWVTENSPLTLFDPAVGPGTFFSAARATGFKGGFA